MKLEEVEEKVNKLKEMELMLIDISNLSPIEGKVKIDVETIRVIKKYLSTVFDLKI